MMQHKVKFLIFATMLFLIVNTTKAEASEGNWIITDKGCKVWNPSPQPNESVTWSGECVDGKAHGNGILQWYQNRIESSQNIITTKNGITMVNGVMTANVDPSAVDLSMIECRDGLFAKVIVKGVVEKEIDLSEYEVAPNILEKAAHFAKEKCPIGTNGFEDIYIYLCRENEELNSCAVKAKLDAYSYSRDDKPKISNHSNREHEKRRKEEYAKYNEIKAEKERVQQEKEKQIEAQKKIEAAKKKSEIEMRKAAEAMKRQLEISKRYDEFVKKYGVKDWPSSDTLSANPFVYEGKTVAIKVEFREMLTATQGLFSSGDNLFVVSNIPKGFFTSKATVILASRGAGKTETKLPLLGTVSVPHLKYVGVHFCKDWQCSDIVPR